MLTHLLLLSLLTIISISENADSARILGLFPHSGKSHQMVYDPLLKTLAKRGHDVTVISFFPVQDPPGNYTTISLEPVASLGVESINLSEEYERPNNKLLKSLGIYKMVKEMMEYERLAGLAVDLCGKIIKHPPVADALKKEYDVVILETFNSDCMLGLASVYGQSGPFIGLSSCVLMQWTPDRIGLTDNPSYVPIVNSDYTSKMTFSQRLENTIMDVYFKLWYRYAIQRKEQVILEKHFGKKIPDLQVLAKNISLVLVNSFHSLNGVKPLLPAVVEVGGMYLDHSKKTIPSYIEKFLNESKHGVVLFSWGSLIKTASMSKEKEALIMKSLSKIKQNVIWKYENSDDEGTRIGNVMKVKWIPQYQLLQHKKIVAFISHGGLLGMTEAVSAGKPMLITPFYGDQPQNGASAESLGIARVVSYTDLTEEMLLEGLQDVLSVEMRENAQRVSKIWKDRIADPLDTAVYYVERIIRWGHLDPLHSTARDLSFIEHNLLDVAVIIVVALIAIISVIIIVIKTVFRLICGKDKRKEKKN